MAKIRVGLDYLGHLDGGDAVVATRCVTVMFLPLVPLGTYRLLDGERGVPAPFNLKSLFAAYFKPWAFIVAAVLAGFNLFGPPWWYSEWHPVLAVVSWLLFAAVFASWLWLGHRPGPHQTGRRRVIVAVAGVVALVLAVGTVMRVSEVAAALNNGRTASPQDVLQGMKSSYESPRTWFGFTVVNLTTPRYRTALMRLPAGTADLAKQLPH